MREFYGTWMAMLLAMLITMSITMLMVNTTEPCGTQAAAQSGLPLLLGLSARITLDGLLVQFGDGTQTVPFSTKFVISLASHAAYVLLHLLVSSNAIC
jgi:hypothetical protein